MIKIKEYKFITIKESYEELFEEKPVYKIYNKKSHELLGGLSYYRPWRQYVFSAREQCVFNNSCLRDVLDFMEKEIT